MNLFVDIFGGQSKGRKFIWGQSRLAVPDSAFMRISRRLGDGPCSYYHVLSRVIERRFILGEEEQG